jgi:glutaredoxin-like protein NrdH
MAPFSDRESTLRIAVYTKPGCIQYLATIRAFEHADLHFATISITAQTQAQAHDFIMSLGYLQAPMAVCGSSHWSGFRPDRVTTFTEGAAR